MSTRAFHSPRRRSPRAWAPLLWGLAFALGACSEDGSNTQILVHLTGDTPARLDIDLSWPGTSSADERHTLTEACAALPAVFQVAPHGDAAGEVELTFSGYEDGALSMRTRARAAFVAGETRVLELALRRGCGDSECAPPSMACDADGCTSLLRETRAGSEGPLPADDGPSDCDSLRLPAPDGGGQTPPTDDGGTGVRPDAEGGVPPGPGPSQDAGRDAGRREMDAGSTEQDAGVDAGDGGDSGGGEPDPEPTCEETCAWPCVEDVCDPVVDYSANTHAACRVRASGSVECTGSHVYGMVGDGTQHDRGAPSTVAGLPPSDQVIVGHQHVCARSREGEVYCWGSPGGGANGSDKLERSAQKIALDDKAVDLAGVHQTNCVVVEPDGGVKCWGRNVRGVLGAGAIGSSFSMSPVAILTEAGPALSGAEQVVVMSNSACARLADGHVTCWGANGFGELGDGDGGDNSQTADRPHPEQVPGLEQVTHLLGRGDGVLARLADGGYVAWGRNALGEFGLGSSGDVVRPEPLTWLQGAVPENVLLTARFLCAIVDGALRCAGADDFGQLARGAQRGSSNAPVNSESPGFTPLRLAGGWSAACAIGESGAACWGSDNMGQLMVGAELISTRAVDVVGGAPASHFAVGTDARCAVASGQVSCWGGTLSSSLYGVPRSRREGFGSLLNAGALAFGSSVMCALDGAGTVHCAGRNTNDSGGLPGGRLTDFTAVPGVANAEFLAAGSDTTCAVGAGELYCWGTNSNGQVTPGANQSVTPPTLVDTQSLSDVSQVAVGMQHVCGLHVDGSVRCWGTNGDGELGAGTPPQGDGPTHEILLTDVSSIDAGWEHTCAIAGAQKQVWCWGANGAGQLGDSTNEDRDRPVYTGVDGALDLGLGGLHSCAALESGKVRCWGANFLGQLGDGSLEARDEPVEVLDLDGAVEVDSSPDYRAATGTCARRSDGSLACWGTDVEGALGSGRSLTFGVPTPMVP